MVFLRPALNRDDVEAITRELRNEGVDGIMIVMLTYGPAMRTVRALLENPLPVLGGQRPARAGGKRPLDHG